MQDAYLFIYIFSYLLIYLFIMSIIILWYTIDAIGGIFKFTTFPHKDFIKLINYTTYFALHVN